MAVHHVAIGGRFDESFSRYNMCSNAVLIVI